MAMLPNLSGLNSMNPNRVARQQARMQTQQMVPQRQQAMAGALLGGGQNMASQMGMTASPGMGLGQQFGQPPQQFGQPPQQQATSFGSYSQAPPQQMGGAVSSGPQGNYNAMMGGVMPPPPNMGQIGGIQASPGAQQAMSNAQAAPQPTPGLGSTRSGGGLLR